VRRIDFERKMTALAASGNEGRPLRTGPGCLVRRWWKRPCLACQKNSNAMALNGSPRKPARELDELLRRARTGTISRFTRAVRQSQDDEAAHGPLAR
jgi:hypothetical protein